MNRNSALHVPRAGTEICAEDFGLSLEPENASRFDGTFGQGSEGEVIRFTAAALAHDINNILHISAGAIDLIQNRSEGWQNQEVSDLLRVALMSVKRASATASGFLTFTQPQLENSSPICLSTTIASMAELLKCTLGDEIELKLSLGEGLSRIVCSRQPLENAVINLVINARGAMPFGGTVIITTFHVELTHQQPDGGRRRCVGIRVTDTGEGMAPNVAQRACDPFYTTKAHGTGLGLAMIKSLVEQFRGKMSVTSVVGKGTTVQLHFPAA